MLTRPPYLLLLIGPLLLFVLGFSMNAVVMAANNGQMPVLIPGGCTADVAESMAKEAEVEGIAIHACMTPATRLKFLGDWIVWRGKGVASPGDFLELFYN